MSSQIVLSPGSEKLLVATEDARRAVEAQIEAFDRVEQKIARLITLGVAAFGGALAMAAFIVERLEGFLVLACLAPALAAAGANFVALYLLVQGYGILPRRGDVRSYHGPEAPWCAQAAMDAGVSLDAYRAEALRQYAFDFQRNLDAQRFILERRRRGTRWLIAAVGLYALGGVLFLAFRIS